MNENRDSVTPYIRKLADSIRADMPTTGKTLPSMKVLGARYSASHPTVAKALRCLEDEGLLTLRKGGRAIINGRTVRPPLEPEGGPVDRVYEMITRDIMDRVYSAAEPLPKIEYLARAFRTSKSTVSQALRMLRDAGAVHRYGKSWVVGCQEETASQTRMSSRSHIAIIQTGELAWQRFLNPRTGPFGISFVSEISRRGLAMMLVDCETEEKIGPTIDRITILQGQCRGCLVVGAGDDGQEAAVLQAFSRLRCPQVFVSRQVLPGIVKRVNRPGLWYCRFADERFSCKAIEHLVASGHRRAAFVANYTESWHRQRREHLRQWTHEHPGTNLVSYDDWIAQVKAMPRDELAAWIEALSIGKIPHCRKAIGWFAQQLGLHDRSLHWPLAGPTGFHHLADVLQRFPGRYPTFPGEVTAFRQSVLLPLLPNPEKIKVWEDIEQILPALFDPDITALIISRDRGVAQTLRSLKAIGIEIPRDISAISYDNDILYAHYAITSIDPGADDLGYQAFHVIERDIPMRLDRRTGVIEARPWVADRCSVAVLGTR